MSTLSDLTKEPVIKLPEATRDPWPQALAALLVYCAVSFAFFGSRVAGDFTHSYMAGSSPDPQLMVWSMAYWPHALTRLGDPLLTHIVWAPFGYNLAWATTVPLASVAMWPITALFGPVASFNVLAIAAPALAAWTAFLLCREITHRFVPALVGGYFFGFSSYMLAHLRGGHLNLLLVFLVPLFPLAFAPVIADLPVRRLLKPVFERAFRPVVFEAEHLLGHGDDRLLHDILRLGVVQPGLRGDAVNQLGVGVEELLPTRLVFPVFQPAEQAAAGRNKFVFVHEYGPR